MAKQNKDAATQLAKVLWYYNLIPTVNLTKYKIVCPFHGDINPSMLVNFEDGSWFCFGCGQSGDAEKFVKLMEKKYHKLNDLQACKQFYNILKSDKCSDIVVDPLKLAKDAKPKKQLYDEAYDYYHGLRTVDWKSDDEDEVQFARQYMLDRGFEPKALNKCKAKVTYSAFYGLIFPMMDNGKFKGWVCRTMRKDIEKRRKYLYNEGFSRATTLVGDYGKKDYVFVVEGYMDRLKFIQHGIYNVVAILGWKMSLQQQEKLRKAGVVHIISALDNDECGIKGTKYLERVFGSTNVTRWKYLKGIKDPGDMDKSKFDKMYNKTMETYRQQHNIKKEK